MRSTEIIALLLLFSISSCKKSENSTYIVLSGNSPEVSVLAIPIDSLTPPRTDYLDYIESGGIGYLAWLNQVNFSVQLYDLEKRALAETLTVIDGLTWDRIHLEKSNKASPKAFFNTEDQVVIYPHHNLAESIFFSLKSLKKIKKASIGGGTELKTITYTSNPILVLDDQLYFTIDPLLDLKEPIQAETAHVWIKSVNLNNDQIQDYYLTLPPNYDNQIHCPASLIPSIIKNGKNEIVISWPLDDAIYTMNPQTQQLLRHEVKSSFSALNNKIVQDPGTATCSQFYENSYQYEVIKFDEFRDLYYLFYSKPGQSGKTTGFLILDSNFNVIGEIELFHPFYHIRDVFVSRAGLNISNNHFDHPLNDESTLNFTSFSF